MKKIIVTCIFSFIVLSLFNSCTSVTDIEATWKKPAAKAQKYSKILVLGIYNNLAKRSAVENAIVKQFRANGISAVAGNVVLPDSFIDANGDGKVDNKNKDVIVEKLKKEGIDGAFVFKVDDVKESEHYVPGTSYYSPYSGYYPFYNYYWNSYETVYTPGYYTTTTNIFLTSNFYNVKDEQLLWSTQSKTLNPVSLSDFAASFSESVVNDFLSSGLVRK